MNKKLTFSIAGASILLTFVGLISRGFGFIREIVFAGSFGLQTDFDVYLIGAVIPITLNSSVNYLAQNYFIPIYHDKLSGGKESAEEFFNNSFWLFIFSSAIVSAILFTCSSFLIKVYFSDSNPQLFNIALNIFRIFIVTIPINAGYSILASYSQAEFNFKSPAISNLFQNILVIVVVLVFTSTMGIYTIPAGYLAGTTIQFIYLYAVIRKQNKNIFSGMILNLKALNFSNKILVLTIFVEIINQLYSFVDRYFYNNVDPGGIAALNYAIVLYTLPVGLLSLALSTAIFPKFSQSLSEKNQPVLQNYFSTGIKINLFLFIPITFLFVYFGDSIIKLFYERGVFSSSDTFITYEVLKIYSFSFIFYTTYAITNKIIYSARLIKGLLIISSAIFLLKIILSMLLAEKFKQNGLALATSICYILLSISCYFLVIKKLKLKNTGEFFTTILFYCTNGFIAFIILQIAEPYLRITNLVNFILSAGIFIIVYTINLAIIKPPEYILFKDALEKIIRK